MESTIDGSVETLGDRLKRSEWYQGFQGPSGEVRLPGSLAISANRAAVVYSRRGASEDRRVTADSTPVSSPVSTLPEQASR